MIIKMVVLATLSIHPPTATTKALTIDQAMHALEALKGKARQDRADMVDAVIKAAKGHGICPLWLLAVGYAESRHKLRLNGDGGRSHGPWQMTMSAARTVRKQVKRAELYQWHTAADTAAAYWARLFRKYGPKAAPVVYNCGPVRCRKSNGKQRKSTPATRAYHRYYKAMSKRLKR